MAAKLIYLSGAESEKCEAARGAGRRAASNLIAMHYIRPPGGGRETLTLEVRWTLPHSPPTEERVFAALSRVDDTPSLSFLRQ